MVAGAAAADHFNRDRSGSSGGAVVINLRALLDPSELLPRRWERGRLHDARFDKSKRIGGTPSAAPGENRGGQAAVAANALRHGLIAETVIDVLENSEDYRAFEAAVIANYDAQDAVECELVLPLASLATQDPVGYRPGAVHQDDGAGRVHPVGLDVCVDCWPGRCRPRNVRTPSRKPMSTLWKSSPVHTTLLIKRKFRSQAATKRRLH
jgi:hypothetical protein